MCTAVSCVFRNHYFGRNLDLDIHYKESVTITPRGFPWRYRHSNYTGAQFAIIGIATVEDGFPLYYEASNEAGLSIAGLHFPSNAYYPPPQRGKLNIASFELIPWLLTQFSTVSQVREHLKEINICNTQFNPKFTPTPLHWLVSDRAESITVEPLSDGVRVTPNPMGVLTNNPPFDYHLENINNYLNLTPQIPQNRFASQLGLIPYSLGMGGMGLPGDFSSASRFVRACFVKLNSTCPESDDACVAQMFHIFGSVAQYSGCVLTPDGYQRTIYTSCCNTDKGIFYYTTYSNPQINAVDMYKEDLDSQELKLFPLNNKLQISYHN